MTFNLLGLVRAPLRFASFRKRESMPAYPGKPMVQVATHMDLPGLADIGMTALAGIVCGLG